MTPWREAMADALYGPAGFYLNTRPHRHFRTSASSPVFAEAIVRLLAETDERLGRPERLDFVDVGAGDGLLAARVLARYDDPRLRVCAVDLSPRPQGLDDRIHWLGAPPRAMTGLAVANEWLDNVPVDVVEQTEDGPRLVLVDPATGREELGGLVDDPWLDRWWPPAGPGSRAEIGRPRDEAWAALVASLHKGTAVAIDYAHPVDDRPLAGTLTGYRDGLQVTPVPDGTCDLTAHVALDACAAAGERAGARTVRLATQREALGELGVRGQRPELALARIDPPAYLRELARATEEAQLISPYGLGGFGWLVQIR